MPSVSPESPSLSDDAPHVGEPYESARAHLADRFRLLGLLLDRLEAARAEDAATTSTLDAQLASLEADIQTREAASEGRPIALPLFVLRRSLRLSPAAERLLVALAGSELDPALLRRYVPLWAEGRHGDVAFYDELCGRDGAGPRITDELQPESVLARHGLIELLPDRVWGEPTPRLFRRVRLGPRVASFLAGELAPAEHALPWPITVRRRGRRRDELVVPPELLAQLERALDTASATADGPRGWRGVCLVGAHHTGRKSLAQAVLGVPLVLLDCGRLGTDPAEAVSLLRVALCEAALQHGALYLDRVDALLGEARLSVRQALAVHLVGVRLPIFLGLEGPGDELRDALPDLVSVPVPMPDTFAQARIWSQLLPDDVQLAPGQGIEWLVAHYSLPAGSIQRCIDDMAHAVELSASPHLTPDQMVASVRRQLGSRFGDLAELVVNTLTWDDLVLQPDALQRVLEVVTYFRHRDRILGEWGFQAKLPYGRSLSVLLSGEPGTGKTMVAGLLAKEMGLELFRVNISKVVDKYIGETEKNLGKIFDEARRGQVALLFDEADSLFSKRTEVRNSNDRYSNLAINFLLQSVESHDGVILLTTNHDKAMDPAFKRRIRFRIQFPFPDLEERAALWRSMVPAAAPVEPNIRWEELAREFDLAGGSIKNAVVRAAVHAVERRVPLSEALLRHTGRLEAEEMGRLVRGGQAAE